MLDFCAEHGIGAEIEVIAADQINEAYERVLASDVRYRFVIDTATLRDVGPPARPSGVDGPAGGSGSAVSRSSSTCWPSARSSCSRPSSSSPGLLPEIAGDLQVERGPGRAADHGLRGRDDRRRADDGAADPADCRDG